MALWAGVAVRVPASLAAAALFALTPFMFPFFISQPMTEVPSVALLAFSPGGLGPGKNRRGICTLGARPRLAADQRILSQPRLDMAR